MPDSPDNWTKGRDDYGRPVHTYRFGGRVVKLPATAIAHGMLPYLANDWTRPAKPDAAVTFHSTLASAKAHLVAVNGGPK
jgi:hypothetical protein